MTKIVDLTLAPFPPVAGQDSKKTKPPAIASRSLRDTDLKSGKETMSSRTDVVYSKALDIFSGGQNTKHNVASHMDAGGTTTGISWDFTSSFWPKYAKITYTV